MSRSSLARKEIGLPLHNSGLDRKLPAGKTERLLREALVDAGELEHHAAGLHDGDPVLGCALAGAHARLGRLLRHRLVGEDVDPDLPAAADLARHRDSRGLDLAVGHPPGLHRFQAEVARLHTGLALREARATAALVLAELRFLREQHLLPLPRLPLLIRGLGRLVAGLLQLGWVLDLLLGSRRVRSLGDCLGRLGRLRLDRRLLPAFGGDGVFVGARALDVVLAARAVTPSRPARPALASPPLAHGSQPLAVGPTAPAALTRGAETLDGSASAARRVLVAETRVALGDTLIVLRHDLALVDPDLHADAAEGRLRLGEAVVDIGADRVQRDAALRVHLRTAHLAAAEPAAADHLHPVGAGAHR